MGIVHLARAKFAGPAAGVSASELDEAVGQFKKASEISPRWAYARHNLALTYNEKGDYRQAEKEYKKAIEFTPFHPYLQYNLGPLQQNQNRLRDAEAQYKSAESVFKTLIDKHTAARNFYNAGAAGEKYYRDQAALEARIIVAFRENLCGNLQRIGNRSRKPA